MENLTTVEKSSSQLLQIISFWDNLLIHTCNFIPVTFTIEAKCSLARIIYNDSLSINILKNRVIELRQSNSGTVGLNDENHNVILSYSLCSDTISIFQELYLIYASLISYFNNLHYLTQENMWEEPTIHVIKSVLLNLKSNLDLITYTIKNEFNEEIDFKVFSPPVLSDNSPTYDNNMEKIKPIIKYSIPSRDSRFTVVHAKDLPKSGSIPKEKLLGYQLHSIAFCVEVTAIEICSYMIASNPSLPWDFRFDLARQINDEARHTEILIARMKELNVNPGEFPIHLHIWEHVLIGESLLEQLCIQQVIQEGHGLDSDIVFSSYMREVGDHKTSVIFDFIGADELNHVRLGVKWMSHLTSDDHEVVINALNTSYDKLLQLDYSPKMPVQENERQIAGMSVEHIAKAKQIVRDVIDKEISKALSKRQ